VPSDALGRARQALAEAKADAAARGARPLSASTAVTGTNSGSERLRPVARARLDDPEVLGGVMDAVLAECGWRERAAVGGVFGRWAQIVGPGLASHVRPDSFRDGELALTADSTAWATQLRLLAPDLLRRLNAEVGDGTIRRVRVLGPGGETQAGRGRWRAGGGRGPRDTYG
jgi:predicted nucleic acid-binding Zn ribbon protein